MFHKIKKRDEVWKYKFQKYDMKRKCRRLLKHMCRLWECSEKDGCLVHSVSYMQDCRKGIGGQIEFKGGDPIGTGRNPEAFDLDTHSCPPSSLDRRFIEFIQMTLCPPRRCSGARVRVGMLRGIPLLSVN